MRKALLVFTAVVCATVVASSAALACGGGATACCATKSAGLAPLTAAPAPVAVPFSTIPTMIPSIAPGMARQPLVSGLMQFIDPETGTLTGPTTLLEAPVDLEPALDLSNLPQVQLPNGSWMIDTRGLMLDNYIMRIDPLGRRSFGCSTDKRAVTVAAPIVLSPYAER